ETDGVTGRLLRCASRCGVHRNPRQADRRAHLSEAVSMNARSTLALAVAASFASWPAGAQEAGRTAPATRSTPAMEEVVAVTAARRREEAVQDVPIPISIVDGGLVTDSGSFNVNRVKE